jgi:hypothetical protein
MVHGWLHHQSTLEAPSFGTPTCRNPFSYLYKSFATEEPHPIHFDLAAFRYVSYDNPLHLRDQLKAELEALFEQGGDA